MKRHSPPVPVLAVVLEPCGSSGAETLSQAFRYEADMHTDTGESAPGCFKHRLKGTSGQLPDTAGNV